MRSLKDQYEKVCKDYVKELCKKQDIEFSHFIDFEWVCFNIGTIRFNDVKFDIDQEIQEGFIISYFNYCKDGCSPMLGYKQYLKVFKKKKFYNE